MEENEKQKEAAIYEKDKEINKMQERVSSLESEIEQWKEKETKLKEKVQKVNETKQGTLYFYTDKVHWFNKFSAAVKVFYWSLFGTKHYGPSKICERQPLKKLKGYGLLQAQILLGLLLNTLPHLLYLLIHLWPRLPFCTSWKHQK